jgi:hypothetical protein
LEIDFTKFHLYTPTQYDGLKTLLAILEVQVSKNEGVENGPGFTTLLLFYGPPLILITPEIKNARQSLAHLRLVHSQPQASFWTGEQCSFALRDRSAAAPQGP